ncbi:HAMP domain-containing histidine kinase [Solibacillus sp. MA9]|uniref:histidine kinase n=1 Tax=Solibacillus palustris TaxID=2908203 RepID=A0ABS9UBW3_9BACL|nr:HAMP domain-containing sensor histidine kinase [Solibacillus sp. MA9]MCH7321842.1 HAMP domain-containing histidine kinase [Solibacillus sp. MA9]
MKLKTKINIVSISLTMVILISSFTGIYFLYEHFAITTEAEHLQTRALELTTAISALEQTEGIDMVFRAHIPTDGAIIVQDANDKTLIRLQTTAEKIDVATQKNELYTVKSFGNIPYIAISTPMIWPDGQIVEAKFIQPLPTITENLNRLFIILLLMTLLALVPIFLASQLLVRLIVKPVTKLTTTMERNIQQSSFEQLAVNERSKDEIMQMTSTYNTLMAQLEDLHDKQQQFIGNASHELKTPLTVIESYAKLLKRRGTENVEVTDEALHAIIQESANMKHLIEQMLSLAKSAETTKITVSNFELSSFLQTIAANVQTAYHREIHLKAPNVVVMTDESMLKQLLFIFIDNARKYSDGFIELHASVDEYLHIEIRDNGIGIPKQDLPHIFNRFYRVNKDRNRKTGGVGIGLSIAQELALRLHATIHVESELGQGTIIQITLPLHGGNPYES